MRVTRTDATTFTAEFESEDELHAEHTTNLAHNALRLSIDEKVALYTPVVVTLRGPFGGEVAVKATVMAMLPDGLALAVDGDPETHLSMLMAKPEEEGEDEERSEKPQNVWDRMREMSQMEKLLLAVKADRTERALLLQDNDPRVLLSLLRNPRLTVDEVVRLAKSSFLNYQIAEVIMKATQWMASLDVRLGLIHNPKTPQAFALRILPTLPEAEIRTIARTGTSMPLKQAALRKLQGK
jgi:hypothetical protein